MRAMADNLEQIKALISAHQDFPKPGVLFRDIFPVLRNPEALKLLINIMCDKVKAVAPKAEVIIGLESRGFLFGPMMAAQLGIAFAPVRKAGKLPGECYNISYTLEYGSDKFEIQKEAVKGGQTVVIIDDLLATGGTMKAAVDLMEKCGANISACLVIIELKELNGSAKITKPFYSLIPY